ncbi:ABC transporter ATP-binding protein [Actinoplanes sp. NPDC051859]|uniref:ABC transporter ATP-binding protein n=1 Tax=Actinoplanes sp. NPDC051859 TaxID=3363909 RepID=UPI00378ADBBD
MPEEPPAALRALEISHGFGAIQVLHDCTLTVPQGAVVALLGRNGAGKTTLLRALVGLLRPHRGRIEVFGQPFSAAALPRIGYVDQQAPLYPMLTVAETLRLGGRLNPHWDHAYARKLTAAADLPDTARVRTLSAGQRTRLALALALGKAPDLLVLDEPLAALDPVARTEVVGALMAGVAERGLTVLMSSHVVADIQDVCDHVVVLGAGRVRLSTGVEQALAAHHIVVGTDSDLAGLDVIDRQRTGREITALVRGAGDPPTLEELLLGYLRADASQPTEEVSAA